MLVKLIVPLILLVVTSWAAAADESSAESTCRCEEESRAFPNGSVRVPHLVLLLTAISVTLSLLLLIRSLRRPMGSQVLPESYDGVFVDPWKQDQQDQQDQYEAAAPPRTTTRAVQADVKVRTCAVQAHVTGVDVGVDAIAEQGCASAQTDPLMTYKLARDKQAPMDVVFLFDSSASVGEQGFSRAKDFVAGLIGEFDMPEVRAGMIRFESTCTVISDLEGDQQVLFDALAAMSYSNGETKLVRPLRAAEELFRNNFRVGATQAIILVTDGDPNDESEALKAAEDLRRAGVRLLIVGVGSDLRVPLLHQLASSPAIDNVFEVASYDALRMETQTAVLTSLVQVCQVVYRARCNLESLMADGRFIDADEGAVCTSSWRSNEEDSWPDAESWGIEVLVPGWRIKGDAWYWDPGPDLASLSYGKTVPWAPRDLKVGKCQGQLESPLARLHCGALASIIASQRPGLPPIDEGQESFGACQESPIDQAEPARLAQRGFFHGTAARSLLLQQSVACQCAPVPSDVEVQVGISRLSPVDVEVQVRAASSDNEVQVAAEVAEIGVQPELSFSEVEIQAVVDTVDIANDAMREEIGIQVDIGTEKEVQATITSSEASVSPCDFPKVDSAVQAVIPPVADVQTQVVSMRATNGLYMADTSRGPVVIQASNGPFVDAYMQATNGLYYGPCVDACIQADKAPFVDVETQVVCNSTENATQVTTALTHAGSQATPPVVETSAQVAPVVLDKVVQYPEYATTATETMTQTSCAGWSSDTAAQTSPAIRVQLGRGRQKPMDIAFCIGCRLHLMMRDHSLYESGNFEPAKEFLRAVVNALDMPEVQIGLLRFEERCTMISELTGNKEAFLKRLDHMEYSFGETNVASVLKESGRMLKNRTRKVPKVIVVIIDDEPRDGSVALEYAQTLRDQGIRIVFVTVGAAAQNVIIPSLATWPSERNIITAAAFDRIEELASCLLARIVMVSIQVRRAKCTLPLWPYGQEGDLDLVEGHDLVLPEEPMLISEVPWDLSKLPWSHAQAISPSAAHGTTPVHAFFYDDEASRASCDSVDVRNKRALLESLNRALLRARFAEDAVEDVRRDAQVAVQDARIDAEQKLQQQMVELQRHLQEEIQQQQEQLQREQWELQQEQLQKEQVHLEQEQLQLQHQSLQQQRQQLQQQQLFQQQLQQQLQQQRLQLNSTAGPISPTAAGPISPTAAGPISPPTAGPISPQGSTAGRLPVKEKDAIVNVRLSSAGYAVPVSPASRMARTSPVLAHTWPPASIPNAGAAPQLNSPRRSQHQPVVNVLNASSPFAGSQSTTVGDVGSRLGDDLEILDYMVTPRTSSLTARELPSPMSVRAVPRSIASKASPLIKPLDALPRTQTERRTIFDDQPMATNERRTEHDLSTHLPTTMSQGNPQGMGPAFGILKNNGDVDPNGLVDFRNRILRRYQDLHRGFFKFDTSGSGKLSSAEFSMGASVLGLDKSSSEKLFYSLQSPGSIGKKYVTLEEWIRGLGA